MNDNVNSGFLYPYIRCLNGSDMGDVEFYMFNTHISGSGKYGEVSPYVKCERGLTTFRVCPKGESDNTLASMALDLKIGQVYTVCAVGNDGEISMCAVEEPTDRSNMEYGHIRICDLWKDCESFNLYAEDSCIIGGIEYPQTSKYIEIAPGVYYFTIRDTKEDMLLECGRQNAKAGKYNTLYILQPKEKDSNAYAVFTVDAASYNGFYL